MSGRDPEKSRREGGRKRREDDRHPFLPSPLHLLIPILLLCLPAVQSAKGQTEITKTTLPGGVRVIVQPDTNSDVVAICVFVRAGIAEEGGAPGLGRLVANALFGSNYNQSREAVERAIFSVGGSLETLWSPDYTLITCVTTPDAFEEAFYVIGQAIKNAEFDAETLEEARRAVLSDRTRDMSSPFSVAYEALRAAMYQESPYRLPFGGTPASLRRLSREAALRYFRQRFTPESTVVAIVGNISAARAQKAADIHLYDYDRPAARSRPPAPPERLTASLRVERRMSTHTTLILAGFNAPGLTDPDYPAFAVLTALVGGGRSSRLFRAVRDAAGVGYVVGAQTPPLARASHLLAYVEFDAKRIGAEGKTLDPVAVERLLVETVRSVLTNPPTGPEVERAKRFAIGTHALAHQRTRDRALYLGWYELLGLGHAYDAEYPRRLAAVTPDDVLRVAKQYLNHSVVSVVQPGP